MVIKDVLMMYAKLQNPTLEYNKKPDPDKPHVNKEFTVVCLLKPKAYSTLKSKYKAVKSVKDADRLTAEDFEEKYKFTAPEEYANSDGEYIVITFRKKAYYKDGNPNGKPNQVGCVAKTKDRDGNVVTDVSLGNGTSGHIQVKERTWDNEFGKGIALDLVGVCITKLIAYVKPENDEFDYEDDDENEFEDEGNSSDSSADTDVGGDVEPGWDE